MPPLRPPHAFSHTTTGSRFGWPLGHFGFVFTIVIHEAAYPGDSIITMVRCIFYIERITLTANYLGEDSRQWEDRAAAD